MQTRTEGIVLRTFPYAEADLLVTYLTPDHGIRKAFAKSSRKTKSRFGASLEPLTHSRITFMGKEDAELPRLTQSDILRPHQGLREGLACFALASEMVELTMGLLPPGKPVPKAFSLLKEMLAQMEADCTALGALVYKIRLLALKGYSPRLSGCGRCDSGAARFYPSQGAVICQRCCGDLDKRGSIEVSPGSLRLYESLSTWELDKTARIKPSEALLAEVRSLLYAHLEYILSVPLRSRVFTSRTP